MKNITLNFNQEQLALLDKAIQQMPYYLAAPLISHINREMQKNHDRATDARETPSGATVPGDHYRGE